MYVRKVRAGSAAGHTWPHDGAVVEVPDGLGHELLTIPDGGFAEVRPGDAEDAGDGGEVRRVAANAGLIRLAVVAELVDRLPTLRAEVADELRGELASQLDQALSRLRVAVRDDVLAELRREGTLTADGTAAPAAVSAAGGPAAADTGTVGAGPPAASAAGRKAAAGRPVGRG